MMSKRNRPPSLAPTNLWPDFEEPPTSVRSILLDAGSGIAEKTGGRIKFEVESVSTRSKMVHHCFLVANSIGFRYPFMKVEHEIINNYPVSITADVWPQGTLAGNEEELIKDLGLVFRSEETRNVVVQILGAMG